MSAERPIPQRVQDGNPIIRRHYNLIGSKMLIAATLCPKTLLTL